MQRVHLWLLSLAFCQTLPGIFGQAEAADDPFQSKTINLRSGPITLEPTRQSVRLPDQQMAKPLALPEIVTESATRWFNVPSLESTTTTRPIPTGDMRPIADGKPRPDYSFPFTRPISSQRAILSFERRVTAPEREMLKQNGIEVGDFLVGTSYVARIRQTDVEQVVQSSKDINTVHHLMVLDESQAGVKIDPSLAPLLGPPNAQPSPASTTPQPIEIIVEVWTDTDVAAVAKQLEAYGTVKRISPLTRKVGMSLQGAESIRSISKLPDVQYVSPSFEPRKQNTHVRRNMGVDVATAEPHRLTGKDVRVGVWDDGHVAASHPSFAARLSVDLALEQLTARKDSRHATHVAGIIAGSGTYIVPVPAAASAAPMTEAQFPGIGKVATSATSGGTASGDPNKPSAGSSPATAAAPSYPGVAPEAQILSFEFVDAPEELSSVLRTKPDAIDVVNNSWNIDFREGVCPPLAGYGQLGGPDFDRVVSGRLQSGPIRRIPIVISAGNNRDDAICGLSTAPNYPNYRTVAQPATAKNVITVGAIDADTNQMTSFSGWGPTGNGRLKPDLVAPGCRSLGEEYSGIVSMFPATGVGRSCGTSMAAPAVTGVVALMIEKMGKLGLDRTAVFPSTYKALLIHGAADLGRPGPDFEYGYGRVQIGPTLRLMDDRAFRQMKIEREKDVQIQEIVVAEGADELKVTLVWDDPAVGSLSGEVLSNDLDLVLTSPSGQQHLPFLLDAAAGKESEPVQPGVDRINVVEQTLVRRPAAGVWRINVRANAMGSPGDGQTYSLVMSAR